MPLPVLISIVFNLILQSSGLSSGADALFSMLYFEEQKYIFLFILFFVI